MSETKDNFKRNVSKKIPNKPKFKFNFYWIYGILALVFLGLQFYSFDGTKKEIDWAKLEKMIIKKDIQKLVVINNKYAEVYVKKEKLDSDTTYKDLKKKGVGSSFKDNFYTYKFLTVDAFRDDINNIQNRLAALDTVGVGKNPEKIERIRVDNQIQVSSEERKDWGGEIFGWLLPIIVMVAIFFIIMKVMGRGAGGSQIFNIGKAKAQLFDKDTMVSINFNDVAGFEL